MPTLTEIRDDYSEQIAELERGTADSLTGDLKTDIESIHKYAMAQWIRRFGSLDNDPTPSGLKALLGDLKTKFGNLSLVDIDALVDAMHEAAALGVGQNLDELAEMDLTAAEKRGMKAAAGAAVSVDLDASVINDTAKEQLDAARGKLTPRNVSDFESLFSILTGLNAMMLEINRSVTTMVNASASLGAVHVAREVGGQLMWVSERGACLHCLAYAGQVVDPGENFKGGRTFGDKPLSEAPLSGPPLHPYCRCRLSVWLGSREGVGPTEAPAALQREAYRTVLRGWSPYASEPARLRAADRLIEKVESQMPKSVIKVARDAIKNGEFKGTNPLL